jgi:D-alanine-D-alanine ligase
MLDVAAVRYFTNTITDAGANGDSNKVSQISRMRTFIKSRQQHSEKFLKKLVDTDTYVRNVDGVNYASEIIASELAQLGFTQEVFPQLEVGNITYFSNAFDKEIDHLLLLPIDNKVKLAKHESYTEHEQYLEGTGIWENKGGAAILLSALQSLRFSRCLKKSKIGILLITDSSIDSRYSKTIIQQKSELAKHVIALSGSSKKGELILSRSGSATYRLETKLINKSSSENVSLTAMNFHKLLASITDISKDDTNNIIAPYEVEFKSNIFKMSAYGSAGLSVRFNSKSILDDIEKRIQKLIAQQKRSKIFQIQYDGGMKRPAMKQTDENEHFYKQIHKIANRIDVRISKEHRWSSSDICHIKRHMPLIDGMGPVGDFLPTGNERIIRHSLVERALLLALVLKGEEL